MMKSEDPKKEFEGYGVSLGKVVSFANGFYRIDYEDGDSEDLESHKVVEFLVNLPHLDDEFKKKQKGSDNSVVKKKNQLVDSNEEDEVPLVSLFKQTPPPKLPSSSGNIGVPDESISQLFSVYCFLRSFSIRLFLSPFKLDDFVGSLTCGSSNTLMNAVHYSLLRALRRHLEMLSYESDDASICLRRLDWSLLDTLTWPVYLVEYLLISGCSKGFYADVLDGEYYSISVTKKLMILQILCDNVMESAELRAEVDTRERLEVGNALNVTEIGEECRLCGMHGTLICCDGCPSEYHSRCIGLNQTLIPDGLWFCPECMAQKDEPTLRISAGLRGAEIFGVDPYQHIYLGVCNHLLVLDLSIGQGSYHSSRYYFGADIPKVLQVLCSTEKYRIQYSGICKNIMQFWEVLEGSKFSPARSSEAEINTGEDAKEDIKTGVERENCGQEVTTDDTNARKAYMGYPFKPQSYVNQYVHGDVAASAAANYSVLALEAKGVTEKTVSADIALQQKAFSSASLHFIWPDSEEKAIEVPEDRCGWCLACGNNTSSSKDCLLNMASSNASKGPARNNVSVRVDKNEAGSIVGIATYILYMAKRLQGLLVPPFLNSKHLRKWRKELEEASSFSSLKVSLLEFEKHIRLIAFSADWVKVVDDWIAESSFVHNTTCFVEGPLKRQGRKRSKKQAVTPEVAPTAVPSENDSRKVNWWRGGKLSKLIFQKGILPRKIIRKAARQGGGKKISAVFYTEGSEIPKRRRRFAWRAAVEMSRNTTQLALQVRYLDLHLRWNDMVRPEKETSYRTVVICGKKNEEDKTTYGLLFHQKHLPSRVMKNCINVEQSGDKEEILWFLETHVPLFLIKDFEQMEEKHSLSKLQSIQTLPSPNMRSKGRCTRTFSSYGILWKQRNSEGSGSDFRMSNILLKGSTVFVPSKKPTCYLCSKLYNPDLMYILCEHCPCWYHAEAVQLDESQIFDVVGFKCNKCRKSRLPICPYADPESRMRHAKVSKQQHIALEPGSGTISKPLTGCRVTTIPPNKVMEGIIEEEESETVLGKEGTFDNRCVNFEGIEIKSPKHFFEKTLPLQVEWKFPTEDVEDELNNYRRMDFDDAEFEHETYSSFTENRTSMPDTKPTLKEPCKYCSLTEPAPELHCKVCGCRLHIHCSPWIESDWVDSWKCGGCREWV